MDVKGFYQEVGGNYQAAVSLMMNDAFVARMLTKFFANNTYEDILVSYEKKDFKSLFAASHAFKGVAGNLALTPLFDIASTITEAIRSLEPVDLDAEIGELRARYSLAKGAFLKQANP